MTFEESNKIARSVELRREQLRKIAVVNLKKSAGGPRTKPGEILKAVQDHKDLLVEQLALYNPTLTFACGTFEFVPALFKTPEPKKIIVSQQTEASERIDKIKHFQQEPLGSVVDFWHPQPRLPNREIFAVMRGVLEYLR